MHELESLIMGQLGIGKGTVESHGKKTIAAGGPQANKAKGDAKRDDLREAGWVLM